MVSSFETFRESLFAVFYIMTEQNNQHSKRITIGVIRRCFLYLIDAGQVIRALVLPEFGWDPGVRSFIGKFDFFNLIFDVVGCTPFLFFLIFVHKDSDHRLSCPMFLEFHFSLLP